MGFSDMTMALIDSANDRTEEGQEQISQALYDLGKHKPALVLSSCYSYLKKHTKVRTNRGMLNYNTHALDTCQVQVQGLFSISKPLAWSVIYRYIDYNKETHHAETKWLYSKWIYHTFLVFQKHVIKWPFCV